MCGLTMGFQRHVRLAELWDTPLLYIIYDEAMMKVATENVQDGISVYCATEIRRRIALGEQAFMNN